MWLTKGGCTKALLERYDTLLNYLYTQPVTLEVLGCFSAIQDNFKRDEIETMAQTTEIERNQRKRLSDLRILDPCWEL